MENKLKFGADNILSCVVYDFTYVTGFMIFLMQTL
jgi:hypothetical protein